MVYHEEFIRFQGPDGRAFAARFSAPFLRQVFPLIHNYPPLPTVAHLANLAGWHNHSAGWSIGGAIGAVAVALANATA